MPSTKQQTDKARDQLVKKAEHPAVAQPSIYLRSRDQSRAKRRGNIITFIRWTHKHNISLMTMCRDEFTVKLSL